jgi:hypothetical protein
MLYFAAVQLAASIAGIIVLLLTLQSTRESVKAAMISAEAAEKAAKAARDALFCDRAWVSTRNGAIQPMKVGEPLRCSVEFTNSGRTPALNLRVQHTIRWDLPFTDIEQLALSYEDETRNPPMHVRPLGPNVSCYSEVVALDVISQELANEIEKGNMVIYVFGIVRYDDICGSGVHHITRYCYTVNPSRWHLQTYGKYNDMT